MSFDKPRPPGVVERIDSRDPRHWFLAFIAETSFLGESEKLPGMGQRAKECEQQRGALARSRVIRYYVREESLKV